MRIGIVIEQYIPAAGGNERSTEQIARRLVDRGHEVTVLTNRCEAGDDPLPGGRVVSADGVATKHAAGLMRFVRWAEQRIESSPFDVTVSMTTAVAADVLQPRGGTVRETLARNVALRPGPVRRSIKKLTILASAKKHHLLTAERRALADPRVKTVVAISEYVRQQLAHHYAFPWDRIELIPNAAEVTPLSAEQRSEMRRRVRRSLRLSDQKTTLLLAARNAKLKGLDRLLRALAPKRGAPPEVELIVAGARPGWAQRLARRLRLDQAVRWVGPVGNMDELYAATDVTVLPTWYDPSSKVVLESLLHGVPAISTLCNGASQWIWSPGGTEPMPSPFEPAEPLPMPAGQPAGRVVRSPADAGALRAAVEALCDPAERRRCTEATRGLADQISMGRHVDRLEALLREVSGRPGVA